MLLCSQIKPAFSSLREASAAVSGGKGAVYNSSCFSNLFLPDTNTTTTAVDKPGLVCPTLHIHRPSNQSNLTTAFFYHYVETDPLLYSFANCSCAAPLEPHYHRDTAGLASYKLCLPKRGNFWQVCAGIPMPCSCTRKHMRPLQPHMLFLCSMYAAAGLATCSQAQETGCVQTFV